MNYRIDVGRALRRQGEMYGDFPCHEIRMEDCANLEDFCQTVARRLRSVIIADQQKKEMEKYDVSPNFTPRLSVTR